VAWPLAVWEAGLWGAGPEGLQKVRVMAVPEFVMLEQVSSQMAQFGHVIKAERGRVKLFPSAFDEGVHLNVQLLQGATLHNREEGRTILNVANVFSDLHRKVCFKWGQLACLGQHCKAVVKHIAEQGQVWSLMDVPKDRPRGPSMEVAGPRVVGSASSPVGRTPSPPLLVGRAGLREEEPSLGSDPVKPSSGDSAEAGLSALVSAGQEVAELDPSVRSTLGGFGQTGKGPGLCFRAALLSPV
jgi:hypothetical protein